MYSKETLDKYADVLLWGLGVARAKKLKKSDLIMVRYDFGALPLAEAVVERLHEDGFIPVPRATPTSKMEFDFYDKANNKRLTYEIPGERELCKALAGTISLLAPESLTHLSSIDPERISRARVARMELQEILRGREDSGDYAWTLCMYPTAELARHAGVSLEEYALHVKKGCLLGQGMPVRDWKLLRIRAEEIKAWLNSMDIRGLRVQSENTDLLLKMGDRRRWNGITGRNIPSYEIYTSPDWRGAEGRYYADLPSFRSGHILKGVDLEFRLGEVVRVSVDQGQEFAIDQISMDSGANKVGEFALVDKRFSPIKAFMANTLFDENHGGEHGSCHVALGQSYSNTFNGDPALLTREVKRDLGFNVSALHWDLVNTEEKTVHAVLADGARTLIYENGEFAY